MNKNGTLLVLAASLLFAAPQAFAKDYTVRGYVASGPTTPVPDQQVTLVDPAGNIVGQTKTGWTGGYKFEDVPPGDYYLLTGNHHVAVKVEKKNVRHDFDLSSPDGRLSYTQNAVKEFVQVLQQQALQAAAGQQGKRPGGSLGGGSSSGPMPSMNDNVAGTNDCWAAAGCSYDSSTGTYEMSSSGE